MQGGSLTAKSQSIPKSNKEEDEKGEGTRRNDRQTTTITITYLEESSLFSQKSDRKLLHPEALRPRYILERKNNNNRYRTLDLV